METTQEIHGHEILHLVADAQPPFTRQTLRQEAATRFGEAARYCTCSAFGMTLDELLAFLMARGKIVEHSGHLVTDVSKICNHSDHKH